MKMNDITIVINVQVKINIYFSLKPNTAMRFIFLLFLNDYGQLKSCCTFVQFII